jgi:hypothetical protein
MCWISLAAQKPNPGEEVDVWTIFKKRHCKLEYQPEAFYAHGRRVCELNLVTHWRYPPAPPEGK